MDNWFICWWKKYKMWLKRSVINQSIIRELKSFCLQPGSVLQSWGSTSQTRGWRFMWDLHNIWFTRSTKICSTRSFSNTTVEKRYTHTCTDAHTHTLTLILVRWLIVRVSNLQELFEMSCCSKKLVLKNLEHRTKYCLQAQTVVPPFMSSSRSSLECDITLWWHRYTHTHFFMVDGHRTLKEHFTKLQIFEFLFKIVSFLHVLHQTRTFWEFFRKKNEIFR